MFDGITMYSQTANCALYLAGGVPKARAPPPPPPSSSSSRPLWHSTTVSYTARPSLVFQTEGNENPSSDPPRNSDLGSSSTMGTAPSTPVLSHGDTIGVIGGVSSISTIRFMEKLVKWSLKSGGESPPLIACSDPVVGREVWSNQRNALPYTRFRYASTPKINPDLVVQNLRKRRGFLEQSGARCVVMPCHVSYAWYDDVSCGCSVPFLHVGECVAKELKEARLRPLETGSNVRIGILSPDPALTAGYYREKLENQGFEVVLPDDATMEHTVLPAIEALNRKDMEGARNLLRISLQVLLVRAVNTIILASDEMRGVLPSGDPLLKKCTDPMDVLARSTVHWVRSQSS